MDVAAAADTLAIHDSLHRYCRGIDRCDLELVRSAYHPDATDDHGNFRGSGWDFAAWAIERLQRIPQVTTHTLSNIVVDLDGDTARVEAYFVGTHVIDDDGGSGDGRATIQQYHGRYIDRYERREGRWAIADRRVVHDWNETRRITRSQDRDDPRFTTGRRSRLDAVYVEG